ncbi:MAG: hypothetical protein A3D15_02485 [Alphaproteobacteria bacterium RIFCSPHIGHO2_02_FULL_40_34]|nr:MAG: hypothetical protein A3D15_02485 [Alphaproteobacteria bacterium RIFCSPHIGHO2_02_FULL_40_34]OFX09355.1 MAG: hypothetical protein A3H30_06815 [Alphaproteobacteria bacterium RIFCSPLOWO2_02_FULL_40_19]OFX11887.1 MAG: hypothetical protein A3G22_05635 [Alphaproteobacteria bacterium RIFCSPLOWO2_12_FULL_40_11]
MVSRNSIFIVNAFASCVAKKSTHTRDHNSQTQSPLIHKLNFPQFANSIFPNKEVDAHARPPPYQGGWGVGS